MRPIFARLTACLTLSALLAAVGPAAAQEDKMAEAKKHMEAGAALFNDPGGHKCEEAYREFKAAFDLSASLNALKAMGVCALELERDGDAIAHYKKYIEGKGDKIDAAEKAQIETDLKGLGSTAWITISTDRQNVQLVDVRTPSRGYPVTNKYTAGVGGLKLGIHPGSHVITAKSDGAPDQVWTVEVPNGGALEHGFEFDKGKPVTADGFVEDKPKVDAPTTGTDRPVPTTVFIFGGLTVALIVPTVIFGVGALGKNSDYKAAQGTKPANELDNMKSDVSTANLITDIFLGATVLSAAATAVFYFTRPAAEAPAKQGFLSVTPTASRGGGGAMLMGSF